MKLFKLGINMLIKHYKQSYYYILTITISTIAIFNLVNTSIILTDEVNVSAAKVINIEKAGIISNESIISDTASILSVSIFLIVCIAVLMIGYASYYFIISKTKEVGVIAVSGGSVINTGAYLSAQNSIVQLIGSITGVGLGIGVAHILLNYFYKSIGIEDGVIISTKAMSVTIYIIIIQFIYTLVAGVGYAYRKTISELMVDNVTLFDKDIRKFKIPYWVYIVVYLLPLIGVYKAAGGEGEENVTTFVFSSFFGFVGFFQYGLPVILEKIRKKGWLYNKNTMIWVNNLALSIRKSMILIGTMACIMSLTLVNTISNSGDFIARFVSILISVSFVLIMSITIVYKILAEAYKRRSIFKQLWLVGYRRKELYRIIRKEVIGYFTVILFPTLLPITLQVIGGYIKGSRLIDFQLFSIGIILMINLTIGMISYIGYTKISLKEI